VATGTNASKKVIKPNKLFMESLENLLDVGHSLAQDPATACVIITG